MSMKIILMNSSTDLDALREALSNAHSLRVCVDGDQVKFKVNGGTWSAGMGCIDPSSDYAYYQRQEVDDNSLYRNSLDPNSSYANQLRGEVTDQMKMGM